MSPSESPRSHRSSNPNLPIYILLVGMSALVVVALLILPGLPSEDGLIVPTPLARPSSSDNTLGDPAAPVRVEEFSDFQCPFCRRFLEEVEPRLLENYVVPEKVFFVYRHFPILGNPSVRAAEASLCARESGFFWTYHDVLFANQNEADPQAFSEARLVEFGRAVGLDAGAFSNCISEQRYAAEVQGDSQAGFAAGMNSTPSFLINGGMVVGLVPYEEFAEIVEGALAASTP